MADLVTAAEYKVYAGISSTNEDTKLALLIPSISQLVRTYCNRNFTDFYATNKVEYSNGGDKYIYLQELPIKSIASVEFSSNNGQTYTPLVNYTDYVIQEEYGAIQAIGTRNYFNDLPLIADTGFYALSGPAFLNSPKGYKVTYMGGYATCPADLKLAVLDLIGYYLRADMSIKSTRVAGSANSATVEYVTNTTFPPHIRRVLDMYRLEH